MYKRQIDSIDNIKPLEIYGSSRKGAYFSLNSFLRSDKPFNGLYINKNKVMVSNVFERIVTKGNEYNLKNFATISNNYTNKDYILQIDLDKLEYDYRCQNVTYRKKISFIKDTNILMLDYNIENENDEKVKFYLAPLLTYRDSLHMKKANFLKFGSRMVDYGTLINLSVSENENIVIKCSNSKYIEKNSYVNNIKHELMSLDLKKDTFIEDLFLPGEFEITLEANETKNVKLYIAPNDIDISKCNEVELDSINEFSDIKEEYLELRNLARAIQIFDDTGLVSIPQSILLDNFAKNVNAKNYKMYMNDILDLIKSIHGRYICLNKLGEAKGQIEDLICKLNILSKFANEDLEYLKLKLWLIEAVNKLYEKDEVYISDTIKVYIGNCILDVVKIVNEEGDRALSNIELVSLVYNALKIYEEIFKDPSYNNVAEDMVTYAIATFWDEQKRVLKRDTDDLEITANIEMIYAISLSYSVATKDIKIKLLDTIFRELYTPYGLRKTSRTSSFASGLVFPKYMAHFINANLNQSGVNYATKKIAYNLVKDLLLDIGKYVKDTVKYVYSEKGLDVDYKCLDLYTTSEMIRLYTMFM